MDDALGGFVDGGGLALGEEASQTLVCIETTGKSVREVNRQVTACHEDEAGVEL